MIADTRTNAGLDNVSTFRKLHLFEKPGHDVMMLATAGNLSITQAVINLIVEGFENSGTQEIEQIEEMPSMFRAAQLIGRAVRKVREIDGDCAAASQSEFRRLVSVRRPEKRRQIATLQHLCSRQFHRMHDRHAVSADRRA
jgi:putative proteasome-type protease